MDVGELLRNRREAHGLSQAQLAFRAATSQQALSRIESGLVSPSVETLERLMAALGEELILHTQPWPLPVEDLARAARRRPEDRLARSLSWNRFAGEVALAGKRARERS